MHHSRLWKCSSEIRQGIVIKHQICIDRWTKDYKLARQYLYGSGNAMQDFAQARSLFWQEAEAGNALAMHDLGRMCADGLGRDAD